MSQTGPISSLYVHVPFCAQKCAYCAFYSEATDGGLIERYLNAVTKEMEAIAHDVRPVTIFFGGGTPSILNLRQWQRVFSTMDRLGWAGAAEWTVECNPATVSVDKAKLFLDSGVNRISMGVQSLDEGLLDRLGRVHTRDMVFRSYENLRKAGLKNVNLDLMFAIPGQTLSMWKHTLREALSLGSEHLSTYEVIYEEDTALFARLQAGEFAEDEDLACAMYEALLEGAVAAGFRQYEVANFARDIAGDGGAPPSLACQHNVNYWRGGCFYGVGPSATSYVRGVRWKNLANTRMYCERLETQQGPVESREELGAQARAGETAAFGLRMCDGWNFQRFRRTTGFDLKEGWAGEIQELVKKGWGLVTEDSFRLTAAGLRFADSAAQLFLRT